MRRSDGVVPRTVDEYLACVPEPARGTLAAVRATIRAVVPPETAEVISYGMPTFKYQGVVLHYAAFARHCSLFPGPGVIEACQEELAGYKTSKGTIQFPVDQPPPAKLLKKIAKLRIAENAKKKQR